MSYKILTIDDSRMVRVVVAKTYIPYGCEVYEAANGSDGLTVAATVLPDLIFLDITMSDMSGFVVLEQLRKVDGLKDIPVIMLTAEAGTKAIERADKLGIIGYISKPFKGHQLLEASAQVIPLQPVA
jgi:CheY-like chemotaxis protein